MENDSAVKDGHPQTDPEPESPPLRTQSVKFSPTAQNPTEKSSEVQTQPTADTQEPLSPSTRSSPTKATPPVEPAGASNDEHDSYEGSERSARTNVSERFSERPSESPFRGQSADFEGSSEEVPSATETSSAEQTPAAADGDDSRSSASVAAETEYTVAEDGNIHINDRQKAAIRRLMHPERQEDNAHLGFTKQGKPIKANPYYKYALRAKDGAEDTKPTAPPVTEPHASRLTRRSRRESAHLPKGPSIVLEKIKEEFCEWLASLGSRRNMTVSKERLEELFSLGLENNLVVRPPEVCMTQAGRGRRRLSSKAPQPTPTTGAADARQHKTGVAAVVFCRSPSLTYYPELREKWRQMGLSRRRPIWKSGQHGLTAPPPPRVHYGDWYIPITKWTPLVAGRRLAPPETEEARQLRKRQLANRKLNETLSRSHAMSALREYIHICQLQGSSAFPEATPKLVRDVDELVVELALERRTSRAGAAVRGQLPSLPMAGLMVHVMDKGRQRRRGSVVRRHSSRQPTIALQRGPLVIRPPPMYKPVKTAPGQAARRVRRVTVTGK